MNGKTRRGARGWELVDGNTRVGARGWEHAYGSTWVEAHGLQQETRGGTALKAASEYKLGKS